MVVCFIGGGNQSSLKTTDLPQVTHKMLYREHLAWAGFELTILVTEDYVKGCTRQLKKERQQVW
jgi:hypothetical protein